MDYPILFTTKTCPNCKMAKKKLDQIGFTYHELFADENIELAREFGITSAPTIITEDAKYVGVKAVNEFIRGIIEEKNNE